MLPYSDTNLFFLTAFTVAPAFQHGLVVVDEYVRAAGRVQFQDPVEAAILALRLLRRTVH